MFFVYQQTNDRVIPFVGLPMLTGCYYYYPTIYGVIESYPTIVLPMLTGLPGITMVLVYGPIFTQSSNPALCGVNAKVFNDQEASSGESTTTECGVNHQLLAVMD